MVNLFEYTNVPSQGPVHPAYNPSFSACFSARIVFFSHNKSANNVFQPAYQHSRTGPFLKFDLLQT
jgi:hypothetical protein